MTESDATVYFLTYKSLLQEADSQNGTAASSYGNSLSNYDPDIPLGNYQVDVRCFGLFIAL